MNRFTKREINKMRLASNLIEPPAAEIINECLDEIERLQDYVVELETKNVSSQNEDVCLWVLDGDSRDYQNLWKTSCGDFFWLEEKPSDNCMKYCCYCGKPIKEE